MIDDTNHPREGDSLIEPLSEDNDTPFSPSTDVGSNMQADPQDRTNGDQLNPTHPVTDNATTIDSHQLYDEGLASSAEATDSNQGNAVTDYTPQEDNS
jgi:hypothetical protein